MSVNIVNLIGQLPVHKRKRYPTRQQSEITSIAIHHSATPTGTPEAFAAYHVNNHQWPGIAYAYVVARDGTVYKCNPLTAVTYHVGDSNRGAVGICLVGNYDASAPPERQLAAAAELVNELLAALPQKLEVRRHHDYPGYAWKSCPGSRFPWDAFRRRLKLGR
jgi:N-acetyl-anhydromuramyl-L-alanine amidase AmpD